MNCSIDEEIEIIAQRIRGWREEDNLTLQELAERSGVATSTIQKVETGQMMPSIAVLLKIARGLSRRVSDLLRDESVVTDVVHLTPHDRQPVCVGENMSVERLTGDIHKPGIEMWRVTLYPREGVSSSSDTINYEGEELVLCEEGRVAFWIGEQVHHLEAGHTLQFKASVPHSWHNDGESLTQFTITSTKPLLFRALMQGQVARATEDLDREPEPKLAVLPA